MLSDMLVLLPRQRLHIGHRTLAGRCTCRPTEGLAHCTIPNLVTDGAQGPTDQQLPSTLMLMMVHST